MEKTKQKEELIQYVLHDILNPVCFDCKNYKNEIKYVSVNNAVFLCDSCAKIHKNFKNKNISDIVRCSIPKLKELNNNQLCLIALGGHKKLKEFINKEYPKLQYMSSNIMYKTIAMDYYRNKVQQI